MQQVREDFNRIASLTAREADAREVYANYLLRHFPASCDRALEIGCGFGSMARTIARRAKSVTALDLSPQMIAVARERSTDYPNLNFVLGDFLELDLPAEGYDLIVTLATLHHLPAGVALAKMKALLKPGGVLVLHDMMETDGLVDYAFNAIRLPLSVAVRLWQRGRFLPRREVRRAWAEHGRHESYLTPKGVQRLRDEHLPGGRVFRHLLWRYTIVWRKPDAT
ncbi:MAG TPA: class I SAM-dependent methyltransferase [Pyrinomonadaceae bacterium]|nr:class I SAM-dependent methyltransferase [Pyrinomonadaceae bacterium]